MLNGSSRTCDPGAASFHNTALPCQNFFKKCNLEDRCSVLLFREEQYVKSKIKTVQKRDLILNIDDSDL